MSLLISSTANPRIKAVAALAQPRARRLTGLCTIEGHDEIRLAADSGAAIHEVYLCPELMRASDLVLGERFHKAGVECIEVSEAVMTKMAYREHPDAWLAVAEAPETDLATFRARLNLHRAQAATHRGKPADERPRILLVLDSVEKPGNIGAVLRSADAAGIEGIIASDCRTDMGNPNVIRASKATVFTIPLAECSAPEALDWLAKEGYTLYAASPEGSIDYWSIDFSQPGGTAVAFGSEREGLGECWFAQAAARVSIPMEGIVNSLNIAQSATLVGYEALRQRFTRLDGVTQVMNGSTP